MHAGGIAYHVVTWTSAGHQQRVVGHNKTTKNVSCQLAHSCNVSFSKCLAESVFLFFQAFSKYCITFPAAKEKCIQRTRTHPSDSERG